MNQREISQDGVTILNDEQFVEGLLGGLAWLICIYQFKNFITDGGNPVLSGILTWTLWWYFRKIGVNLYLDYKKSNRWKDDQIKLNMNPNLIMILFILFLSANLIIGFSTETSFGFKDLLLVFIIVTIFLSMYLT